MAFRDRHKRVLLQSLTKKLDIFENLVPVIPQQEISKNFKFFKTSLKILNVFFGGTNVLFWGTTFTFGDNRGFRGFWNFFLLLGARGGLWDSVGRGAL